MTATTARKMPSRVSGFTLIEMMIAGSLGVVVLLAMSELYVQAKKSFQVNEAVARMQEEARFTTNFIHNHTKRAGRNVWKPVISSGSTITYTTAGTMAFTPSVSVAASSYYDNGGLNSSDRLTVKYWSKTDKDCDGTAPNSTIGEIMTNTFEITTGANECEEDTNELSCNGEPIVCGVSNFQVLYGVDTDSDGSANYFVPATSVPTLSTTAPAATAVIAIRTAITFTDISDYANSNVADKTFTTTTFFRQK